MSTAKCDMCHRQRCGTIQKCIECKLSVCRPCATDGRLRGDPRHVMDPDDVEWESARMIRSRKMRQSRADAARRSREDEGFDEDWDDDLLMADAVGHRSLTPERYSAKSEVENAAEILVGMPGHTPDPIQNSVGQEEHFRLGPLDHSRSLLICPR
ncbi:hypothetical protein CDD83_1135 [Cordyceps sp. RAO-2017]|nr:hypothetical protein CDD83_1135 [Cordyceps sp. RAO-2017]